MLSPVTLLLLVLGSAPAPEPPKRRCEPNPTRIVLEPDGRFRCLGIPIEVVFPLSVSVAPTDDFTRELHYRSGDGVMGTSTEGELFLIRKITSATPQDLFSFVSGLTSRFGERYDPNA